MKSAQHGSKYLKQEKLTRIKQERLRRIRNEFMADLPAADAHRQLEDFKELNFEVDELKL